MLKKDELTNPDSCLNKAAADEPIFVLRAQDKAAPMIVWLWSSLAEYEGADTEKTGQARQLVVAMLEWQDKHGRKVPD